LVDFTISNHKGIPCSVIAYFSYASGDALKDLNGRYNTTDGNVCTLENFTPTYDSTKYTNFRLFIPNTELHIASGEHKLVHSIKIYITSTNQFIGDAGQIYHFTFSVPASPSVNVDGNEYLANAQQLLEQANAQQLAIAQQLATFRVDTSPPNVIRGSDGKYAPAPGYKWLNDTPGDFHVVWTPGKAHPDWLNVVASADEGNWVAAPGYRWLNDTPGDMRVVPANDPAAKQRLEEEIARQQQIISQFEQMENMFGAATPAGVSQDLAEARDALARAQANLQALVGGPHQHL
jgi:hypothetical protein